MSTPTQPIQTTQQPDVIDQAIASSLGNVAQHQTQPADHAPDVIDSAISKSLGLPDPTAPAAQTGAYQQAPGAPIENANASTADTRSGETGKALIPIGGDPRMISVDVAPGTEKETESAVDRGVSKAGEIGASGILGGLSTAALGPALDYLGIGAKTAASAKATQQVSTGLLDEYGDEIFRDVPAEAKKVAWNILQQPLVKKAMKTVIGKAVGEEAGRRLGNSVAGTPGAIAGGTLGATIGDKVLSFILGGGD